jgi:O-antigen/teichoic acid export membrane protein
MERIGKVSKNAAALVGARIVTSSLTFLLAIVINKNLGPEQAGIYNYAFALYTILMVIPDFGIGNISIRDVSQENSRMHRYLSNIVSLRVLLGMAAFVLLMLINLVFTAFSSPDALTGVKFWVVFTIAFSLLIEQPFSNSLAENFIALERLVLVALVYLVMGIVKVTLSIYVITSGMSHVLVYLVLIYILTYVYSIIHFYIAYKRTRRREEAEISDIREVAVAEASTHRPETSDDAKLEALLADYSYAELAEEEYEGESEINLMQLAAPPATIEVPEEKEEDTFKLGPFRYDRGFWRYILISAWPLAVVAAGVTLYAAMDITILSWIKGDTEVGLYAAAGMFAKAFVFLTLAINMAILPAISKVGGKHPHRLGRVWEMMMHYTWILVAPLVVITPILARPVLILQEHQFIEAWNISFGFFVVINKQKVITVVVIIGVALKAVLDILTILLWGYMGAAVTVLVTEFIVFAMLFRSLSRELGYKVNMVQFAGSPLFSLGVLYAVAILLQNVLATGQDTFMSSLLYALIIALVLTILYIVLVLITRMVTRKGLQELNELLTV